MTSRISWVESKRFGLLPKPCIEESMRMTHLALFLKLPTFRNYALGKA
jgi:hypothetical protein